MIVRLPSSSRRAMAASMPGSGFPIEPDFTSIDAKLAIMIPPVSVCHQLSWNGWPNACWPQTTASGLSGSPTLARNRSAERSKPRNASAPSFIIMRIERVEPCHVVGNDGLMYMDRALWPSGRTAGEMEQRAIFRRGWRNDEIRALRVDQAAPIERPGERYCILPRLGDHDHMFERPQSGA